MGITKGIKMVRFLGVLILAFSIAVFSGCGGSGGDGSDENSDDQETGPPSTVRYVGTLTLRITNKIPPFDETTKVDVDISKNGQVTFGSGTLSFDSECPLGNGAKIRRTGTYNLKPNGVLVTCNGNDCLSVNENTSYTDRTQQWVGGKKVVDKTMSGTWDGGLIFNIADALLDGSVIQVQSQMGSVTWTLSLLVPLVE